MITLATSKQYSFCETESLNPSNLTPVYPLAAFLDPRKETKTVPFVVLLEQGYQCTAVFIVLRFLPVFHRF